MTAQPDALTVAQQLAEALDGLSGRLDGVKEDSEKRDADLRTYGRRNRRYLVFDIALTVALAVSTFIAVGASQSARDAQASAAAARAAVTVTAQDNRNLCLSSNAARAQNLELWDHLLNLSSASPPRPGETAAEQAQGRRELAALRAYVSHVFAPRDCAHPGPGNP